MKLNKNKILISVGFASILIIALVSIVTSQHPQEKNKTSQVLSMAEINGDPEIETDSGLKYFAGTYSGNLALFSSAVQFPINELNLTSDDTFDVTLDGLDLRVLSDPQLAINGVYPTASFELSGELQTNVDGTVQMIATSMNSTLWINSEPLSPETAAPIINTILRSGGVSTDEINILNPIIFNTQFIKDLSGSLQIVTNSTSNSQQPYFYFSGTNQF